MVDAYTLKYQGSNLNRTHLCNSIASGTCDLCHIRKGIPIILYFQER